MNTPAPAKPDGHIRIKDDVWSAAEIVGICLRGHTVLVHLRGQPLDVSMIYRAGTADEAAQTHLRLTTEWTEYLRTR